MDKHVWTASMCVMAESLRNPVDNLVDNKVSATIRYQYQLPAAMMLSQLLWGESHGMQGSSNPHKLQTRGRAQVAIPTSQLIRCPIMALQSQPWLAVPQCTPDCGDGLLLRGVCRLGALAGFFRLSFPGNLTILSTQFEIWAIRLRA